MNSSQLEKLLEELTDMENNMLKTEHSHIQAIQSLHPDQKHSAANLLHYLYLRTLDIRKLQDKLHILGLSSLASSEGHILRQLQSIRQRLGQTYTPRKLSKCDYSYSKRIIKKRSTALFGEKQNSDMPSVMVTFDSSFVDNYSLIKNLLQSGMNIARINCAHDDESVWSRMIYLVKKASRKTGLPCKIYMDLAGPKLRTILTHKGREEKKVKVKVGDLIWLAEDFTGFGKKDIVIHPNEDGIIDCLVKGNRVFIDDGVIKGEVEQVFDGKASVRIVRISSEKSQIKSGKGLNFPDTKLKISSLTAYDLQCLPFICNHADLVGYSFVRYPEDLENLYLVMSNMECHTPQLIIKIETPESVAHLPDLLFQGMKLQEFGVMIARGDLAVEIGFERMSEIQEEILWICEAAHVPVIWATQVLETLNKSGMATRSEITDAAHAAMAECIMINKGDFTIEVLETLKEVVTRIGAHHIKKRFTFRPLMIARRYMEKQKDHS